MNQACNLGLVYGFRNVFVIFCTQKSLFFLSYANFFRVMFIWHSLFNKYLTLSAHTLPIPAAKCRFANYVLHFAHVTLSILK